LILIPAMIYALTPIIYLWFFWGMYVLVMGLYRAHLDKRLTKFTYCLAAPWLAVGVLVDVIANIVIAPFVFLDIPREWLVTTRLKRYIKQGTGYRATLANAICDHLLDVFDPKNNHC